MKNKKTTVQELLDTQEKDIISDTDILEIMYKDKTPDFFKKDGSPKEKEKDKYSIEYYPAVIEGMEITFSIEFYNKNRRALTITDGYKEKEIYFNEDGQVYYINDWFKTFYIESKEDIDKIKPFLDNSVGAVINGLGENIYLKVYFNESSFMEAGVAIFGNSGDISFNNAYYSYMEQTSPYYNKGWMIWGFLAIEDNTIEWCPFENDEVFEECIEWYKEEYGIDNEKEILDIKKEFILNDSINIKVKLTELGISCDNILEY